MSSKALFILATRSLQYGRWSNRRWRSSVSGAKGNSVRYATRTAIVAGLYLTNGSSPRLDISSPTHYHDKGSRYPGKRSDDHNTKDSSSLIFCSRRSWVDQRRNSMPPYQHLSVSFRGLSVEKVCLSLCFSAFQAKCVNTFELRVTASEVSLAI